VRIAIVLCLAVLSGCAAQAPKIESPQSERKLSMERVEPLAMGALGALSDDPYQVYARPLINNLSASALYKILNGKRLQQGYVYSHQIVESDPNKTVFAFRSKQGDEWGYLTTGLGRQAIANAFLIENQFIGAAYALVLKRVRICLVTQSQGLPEYNQSRWSFPKKPGYFECTGMTNKSIFKVGTGLPAVLGPYYGEKDTILIFKQFSELQQIVQSLKYQFPQLKVPAIHTQ